MRRDHKDRPGRTAAMREHIRKRHAEGATRYEIAAELCICGQAVGYHTKAMGLRFPRGFAIRSIRANSITATAPSGKIE